MIMNRRKLILVILLIIFGLSIGYSYLKMPRLKRIEKSANTNETTVRHGSYEKGAVYDSNKLNLELLDNNQVISKRLHRNIFQPIFTDESKTGSPDGLPLPGGRPVVSAPSSKTITTNNLQTSELPQYVRDMRKFTFLGFLKKDNYKTIFLSSDKEIFLVRKGDKILGRYEVINLTDEALTISVLSDGSEIVIPLVENKALNAPRR